MRRRTFISVLAGMAITPRALWAQQDSVIPVIGFLNGGSATFSPYLIGFRQGLKENGYVEQQNISIEYRWAEGNYNRLPSLAADLVARKVRVIVANTPASKAAQAATSSIPIVFVVGADPIALGLIESLKRPGGNLTGVVSLVDETGPKRVELMRELLPSHSVMALLLNPANPAAETMSASVQEAAHTLGQTVHILKVSKVEDFEGAFAELSKLRVGGLLVANDPLFNTHPQQLIALAERHSLPVVYPWREYVLPGGLMSYGTSLAHLYQIAGGYVARILKGEKAADLPVQQSTKVELVLNLETAKKLGITFPISLLGRADEVIE